jgi:hypothetical protein
VTAAIGQTAIDRSSAARSSSRAAEFLLVGGSTPLFFALSWALRRWLGLDAADYAAGFTTFYAAYVVNDPHFSVTYLLFYRNARERAFGRAFAPAQRARYLLAGFVAPAILAAWGALGVAWRSAPALGWLIQLMFLLVGWHYVKQGFGVMVVLAARRGVTFARTERLALLAHCYAGWAYAWASPAAPGTEVEEKGVVYRSLAHSHGLERFTLAVLLATIVPLVVLLVRKWRREGRLPLVTPLTAMLLSIWSWSIYSSGDPLVRYVIPALHSIQYLYMVQLLKRREAQEREGPPWFEMDARSRLAGLAVAALALGWVLFHGGKILDGVFGSPKHATTDLGATPCFAALFAFVNIHHYLMDSVLWRRENPETKYLRA